MGLKYLDGYTLFLIPLGVDFWINVSNSQSDSLFNFYQPRNNGRTKYRVLTILAEQVKIEIHFSSEEMYVYSLKEYCRVWST